MATKYGEEFAKDMVDRGRRELGGALFTDSNVAQPMYPLRGGYEPSKDTESIAIEDSQGSILGERLQLAEARTDVERAEKGRDLTRE